MAKHTRPKTPAPKAPKLTPAMKKMVDELRDRYKTKARAKEAFKQPATESDQQPPSASEAGDVSVPTFKHATREAWLEAAVAQLAAWFAPIAPLPPRVRVSIGFPSAWSRKDLNLNKAIGQCFGGTLAKDGVPQIFISPVLEDATRALDVLIHELVHAAVGTAARHGKPFRTAALAIGLEGSMRATKASPELRDRLAALVAEHLGPYPHAALILDSRTRQSTRLLLAQCIECDYKGRFSRSTLERGLPACGVCGQTMTPAVPLASPDTSHVAACV